MKTIKQLILLGGAAMMLAACAKEALVQDGAQEVAGTEVHEAVLNITMPDSDTKTTLGAKSGSNYPVYWTEGDVVSLGGVVSTAVTSAEAGTSHAKLVVKTGGNAPFNVLYPGVAGVSDKVNFPSNQEYVADNIKTNTLPMYATANTLGSAFNMQYLGAVLRIPVKFNQRTTVKSLVLSTVGGEGLSGQFTVGTNAQGAFNGELSGFAAITTVTLDINTTFAANATGVFMVAVPKGTYSKGMELKLYDNEGNYMKASLFSESNTVVAGKVYEFATRAYTQDGTVFFISNVADLQNFAETKGGQQYALLEAQLTADINMSGKAYNATGFSFYGTLDGAGHTISGLTKPLFNNLYGSIRNLTISANITEAVPSGANDYGLGILARYAYVASGEEEGDYGQLIENVVTKGSISISCEPANDFSVGGMLGANKGVPMNSCENQASVKINDMTPSVAGTYRVGGLTGSAISASATISGCSNTGAVTVESATMPTSSTIFTVGGLVGYDSQANTVENSTNSGAVTVKALGGADGNPYLMAGGIVGNATAAGFKLSACENLAGGVVTIASTCSAQAPRVGGVIGRVGGDDSQITGCVNRALVDIKDADLTGSCTYGGTIGTVLGDNAVLSGNKNYGELKNASVKLDAVGGFAGYLSQNATVTGCENYGAVSSTAVPGNPQYLGGLVGKKVASKLIAFSNSKNEGDVTITCGEHDKQIFMGGIIAGCPGGNSSFTSCSNSGNITNNATKSTADGHHDESGTEIEGTITPAIAMGGIIGRVTDNAIASISDCTNSGAINNNCAATDIRLGGIIGYTHQKLNGISGCTNSGFVSNNVLADYCYIRIGGIIGYTNAGVSMSECTNEGKIQSNPSTCVDICGLTAYDDNVRLGGCIADYSSTTRSIVTGIVNNGEVVNTGSVDCGWVYMGGLTGYAETLTYQGALNTGYIHNEATVRKTLNLAGMLGRGNHKDQARVQADSKNEGNVFNSGTSNLTRIGGICANAELSTDLTNCTNSGTIKNTGAATELYMGGVCAQSLAYVNLEGSSNSGDVIFEGSTSNTLFIAGVIGYQKTNVNSILRNNTNSGSIICNAVVPKDLEIGGIAGEIYGKLSNCTNSGPISVKANVGSALYLGGVVGWVETNTNNPISGCENTAAGVITVDPGITITSQIWAGGVIGGQKKSIASINTNLVNRGAITFGSDASPIETSNTAYSYIGGVSGGNTDTIIAYENCENYGDMYYKGKHKCRLGGITSFAAKDPKGCICKADIRFYGTKGGTAKSDVGGIVAYYSAENDHTFTDCLYKGDLVTNASSPRAYTGFLVGRQNSDACTFSNCKVGGRVKGVGNPYNTVALVCCTVSPHKIDVENLVVATGTKRHDSVVNNLQLNFGENGNTPSVGVLCAGTTKEDNTTTLTEASTGTMTNCTIGTIE